MTTWPRSTVVTSSSVRPAAWPGWGWGSRRARSPRGCRGARCASCGRRCADESPCRAAPRRSSTTRASTASARTRSCTCATRRTWRPPCAGPTASTCRSSRARAATATRGYSTTADGVVLDLSALRGVRVSGGRATVGPGAQLIDVQRALTRRGVTVPSGSCPTVGIGGLALGGGHGLAGRRFGLTSDNLRRGARRDRRRPRAPRGRRARTRTCTGRAAAAAAATSAIVTSLTLRTHRASRAPRGSSSPGRGPRRARRSPPGSASRRTRRPRSPRSSRSAPPAARARRACPRSASTSAARRRCGGWCGRSPRVGGARASPPAARATSRLVLRWAGCLDGGPVRRATAPTPLELLREVGLLRQAGSARAAARG